MLHTQYCVHNAQIEMIFKYHRTSATCILIAMEPTLLDHNFIQNIKKKNKKYGMIKEINFFLLILKSKFHRRTSQPRG